MCFLCLESNLQDAANGSDQDAPDADRRDHDDDDDDNYFDEEDTGSAALSSDL